MYYAQMFESKGNLTPDILQPLHAKTCMLRVKPCRAAAENNRVCLNLLE
jgi:hypothetical protein